ncbi:MAG: TIGR04283 family arsenosugar biosynthesis glycosyltransferase [Verrucomicrobiota bacterium]
MNPAPLDLGLVFCGRVAYGGRGMNGDVERKKYAWGRILGVLVSVAFLWVVFRKIEVTELAATFRKLEAGWYLLALAVFGLATVCATLRWHLMLRLVGCVVHPGATLRAVLIGNFFNTLLFGPTGGDIAKSALYSRWYREPMTEVLTASVLDRLLGGAASTVLIVGMLVLAAASGGFALLTQIHLPGFQWWWVAVAALIGAALTVLVKKSDGNSFLARWLASMSSGWKELLKMPQVASAALVLGMLVQLCFFTVIGLSLVAVTEVDIPWRQMLWTIPAIALIGALPISMAGAGVREGSALVLLGLYGIPKADAVASAMLTLLAYLLWSALGGLLLWRESRKMRAAPFTSEPKTISVVMPVLNEAEALPDTLRQVKQLAHVSEIIVVDGGSRDGTRDLAAEAGCRVLESPPGRGAQLRRGAEAATGDVILLLHADTWLPANADKAVLRCLGDPTVAGGGFWKEFRDPHWLMAGSRWRCGLRWLMAGRILGDQGFFLRREALAKIGGIPDLPLMEEFELCRRLREHGRLALAGATVTTSTRRFRQLGVLRTYARMWRVTLLYRCGTDPEELRRIYEQK